MVREVDEEERGGGGLGGVDAALAFGLDARLWAVESEHARVVNPEQRCMSERRPGRRRSDRRWRARSAGWLGKKGWETDFKGRGSGPDRVREGAGPGRKMTEERELGYGKGKVVQRNRDLSQFFWGISEMDFWRVFDGIVNGLWDYNFVETLYVELE
uniref:DUF834 domain-containing protein n=1 Tax=Oryza barthii TaxID=65489 RepID=A0A0D3GGQ9_9ORYZ